LAGEFNYPVHSTVSMTCRLACIHRLPAHQNNISPDYGKDFFSASK